MVQFCSALNMMLVCVSAIMALELMALLLGLRAPGAPKMTPCPQISLIVVSIFHILAVYGPVGLCFGYDAPVGFCYHISITRYHHIDLYHTVWGPQGPCKITKCTLNVQISLIVASIFHILAIYGPIGYCFGQDALVGDDYQYV